MARTMDQQDVAGTADAHACLVFENPLQLRSALDAFLAEGRSRGERCICLGNPGTLQGLQRDTIAAGIDIPAGERRGAIQFRRVANIDPTKLRRWLSEAGRDALDAGFTGWRLVIEADPASTRQRDFDTALARLGEAIEPALRPYAILCVFDAHSVAPHALREALRSHPSVLMGDCLIPNVFCEALQPGSSDRVRDEVDSMLAHLRALTGDTPRTSVARELRQQMEEIDVAYRLLEVLSRGPSAAEIYEEALNFLIRWTHADRAGILLFDRDGVLHWKAWRGVSEEYRQAAEHRSPWALDTRDPQPVIVPDILQEPSLEGLRPVALKEGIRALAFIPLVHQDTLLGKFMVYHNEPHEFTAREIRLAQTIAGHVVLGLVRNQAEEDLRLYREIFANSADGIAVIDPEGHYVEQNAAHQALIGYSDEELIGQTPSIHLGEETFERIVRALSSTGQFRGDVKSYTKHGTVLDAEISAFSVRGEAGRPTYFVGVKRDITARKREEEAQRLLAEASRTLASSLTYEQTLAEVARLAVASFTDFCAVDIAEDNDTVRRVAVSHVDPLWEERLRSLPSDYLRTDATPEAMLRTLGTGQATYLPDLERPLPLLFPLSAGLPAKFMQIRLRTALIVPLLGHRETLGAIAFAATAPGRFDPKDIALAEDLARRCALAVENAKLYRHSEAAVRLRDEFLSVAAHELRTPVTSLRGFTQLALRQLDQHGAVDPKILSHAMEVIDQQSEKLATFISQLLDASRIESGRLILEPRETDVAELVRGVVQHPHFNTAHHTVRLQAPGPVIAVVDPLRLEQVVTNLLDNAIKYSPDGGPVDVEVRRAGPGNLVIVVTDHGIGIPVDRRANIFERFYQAHADNHWGGMGLGLYISRQIAELHGGQITAEYPPTGGTRMIVTLPMEPVSRPEQSR